MIDRQSYLNTYTEAMAELSELVNERDQIDTRREEIDQRLKEVRSGIVALAPLCGMNPLTEHPEWFPEFEFRADVGFTSAIRRVLQSDLKRYFSPVAVRDRLKDVGYEIKSKNILPSIHNTLARLNKAGNVDTEDIEGKTCYRWKGPIPQEDQVGAVLNAVSKTLDAIEIRRRKRGLRNVRIGGK